MVRPRALSADDIARLPPDTLALELLARMPERQATRRTSEITRVLRDAGIARTGSMVTYDADVLHDRPELTAALAEAWQRMFLDGLIVDWPPQDPQHTGSGQGDMYMLTRWGRQVRARGSQGQALLRARRRLGVDLHRDLAAKLRDVVAVGAFEQAALIALRAVEARVRRLAGEPRGGRGERLTGTALMQHAFSVNDGPLADMAADPGERVGAMSLFVGAFGAVRNVVAHTEVEWSDSVEAAEYVLLADLLMRLLDRTEQRLAGED